MRYLIFLILLIPFNVHAQEAIEEPIARADCKEIIAESIPRSDRQSTVYSLAYQNGVNVVPTDENGIKISQTRDNQICLEGITDLRWLTEETMTSHYQALEAERETARLQYEQKRQALEAKRLNWENLTADEKIEYLKEMIDK